MSDTITRTMTIEEVFTKFPQKAQRLGQALTAAGLHCVGCGAATWETVEAGCMSHGMSSDQVDGLVRKLNSILNEEVDLSTIQLTPRAASKYLKILDEEGKQGWGIRFAEKAGGCGGFEYILDYSEKAGAEDVIYHSHGIEIHVAKRLEERLLGSEIDYIDGLSGAGFKVTNPNVRSACGCGTSHGY